LQRTARAAPMEADDRKPWVDEAGSALHRTLKQ
jgi:hypothetical protein